MANPFAVVYAASATVGEFIEVRAAWYRNGLYIGHVTRFSLQQVNSEKEINRAAALEKTKAKAEGRVRDESLMQRDPAAAGQRLFGLCVLAFSPALAFSRAEPYCRRSQGKSE